jgi:hypothetical protein
MQPSSYPPRLAELLAGERLNPLGAGTPNEAARPALAALTVGEAFAPQAVRDEGMARACLAGLWLYHDFLDESHRISQAIETTTGSYWHGGSSPVQGGLLRANYCTPFLPASRQDFGGDDTRLIAGHGYLLSFEDVEAALFPREQIQAALVDGDVLFNGWSCLASSG